MNEEINDLLDEAETFKAQGLLMQALDLLRKASRLQDDPVVLTHLGSLATDLELWHEAETSLQKAIGLESGFTPAYFYLGLLYKEQGRFEEALSYLSKASIDEPAAHIFTVLGVIQTHLELINEARTSFRKAISLDLEYEEAYYNLATTLRHENNDEAICLLEKAIETAPDYALAHRELALSLRLKQRFLDAEYHLHRAIELDPSNGWAYIYLGNVFWATERFTQAESIFRKAIDVWPDQSVSYWSLAHYLEHRASSLEVRDLYQKALDIDPSDIQANWRFASYLKDKGEHEEAQFYLRRLLELEPNDERAISALATLSRTLP